MCDALGQVAAAAAEEDVCAVCASRPRRTRRSHNRPPVCWARAVKHQTLITALTCSSINNRLQCDCLSQGRTLNGKRHKSLCALLLPRDHRFIPAGLSAVCVSVCGCPCGCVRNNYTCVCVFRKDVQYCGMCSPRNGHHNIIFMFFDWLRRRLANLAQC